MNIRTLLSAMAVAAAIVACEHDEIIDPTPLDPVTPAPENVSRSLRFSAVSEGSDTKVSLDGTELTWSEGDAFRVLGTNGVDWTLSLTDGAGTAAGSFEGQSQTSIDIDQSAMAVYPSSAFSAYTSGTMTISLPQKQQFTPGSFDPEANIMAGAVTKSGEEYSVAFKNLLGVLKLTLTGADEYISTIELSDKGGKSLWGNASVSAQDFALGLSVDAISGGSSSIILECHGAKLTSTPTTFYINVPVGAFEGGFELTMTTLDSRQATLGTRADNHISRSKIKAMPKIAVEGFEMEEFDISNPALKAYMSKTGQLVFKEGTKVLGTTYPSRGSITFLDNIVSNNEYRDQDRPLYKSVEWTGEASATFHVSFTDETTGRVIYTDREVKGPKQEFQNMVPGHVYSYTVNDTDAKMITAGKFKAVGNVRMVTIEDSWNYRDLGGWASSLGGAVKYELIYRGSSLNGKWQGKQQEYTRTDGSVSTMYVFGEESRQQIKDMGIRSELDLRATIAQESKPSEKKYVHENALAIDNTGLGSDYWTYKQISTGGAQTSPTSNSAAVEDVEWIISQILDDKPVAFHCKSGADRTGCVAMLILSVLGVDPIDICRDYELTTFSREYTVLQGKAEFRTKQANNINPDYKFFCNGFTTLKPGGNTSATQQEKAYYYLNKHFTDKRIPAETLDKFISEMLGISYVHPSTWTWAE